MLEIKSTDYIQGTSTVDGTVAERYTASIDRDNPESMSLVRSIANSQLRKDNRDECRKDQAEFEDECYQLQDEMIAQGSKKEETA